MSDSSFHDPETLRHLLDAFGEHAEARSYLLWRGIGPGPKLDKMPVAENGLAANDNRPEARATLTLTEAVERALELGFDGLSAGVSAYAPGTGLTFIDLDDCVTGNGAGPYLADWAERIVGAPKTYVELSPSGKGLRIVLAGEMPDVIRQRSTGAELHGIGVYGERTRKHMTLTGRRLEISGPVTEDPDLVDRLVAEMARRTRHTIEEVGGIYEPGEAGRQKALEHIRNGTSLHDASVHYVKTAYPYQTEEQIEDVLFAAYVNSTRINNATERFADDDELKRIFKWAREKVHEGKEAGYARPRTHEERLEFAAKIRAIKNRCTAPAPAPAPSAPSELSEGDRVLLAEVGIDPDEFNGSEDFKNLLSTLRAGAHLKDAGLDGPGPRREGMLHPHDLPVGYDADNFMAYVRLSEAEMAKLREMIPGTTQASGLTVEQGRALWTDVFLPKRDAHKAEQDAAEAKAEIRDAQARWIARFSNDPARHDWMLDMPSILGAEVAQHLMQDMKYRMPGAAALGALMALSVASANRYLLQAATGQLTPLNLYGALLAPTGSGKNTLLELLQVVGEQNRVAVHDTVASDAGLHQALLKAKQRGTIGLVMDEYGMVLGQMRDRRDTHAGKIGKMLMTLSLEGATGKLDERPYSNVKDVKPRVDFPYIVLTGVTTGTKFDEHVDMGNVEDGYLNRHLVVDAETAIQNRRGALEQVGGYARVTELARTLSWVSGSGVGDLNDTCAIRVRERWFRSITLSEDHTVRSDAQEEALKARLDIKMAPLASRVTQMIRQVAGLLALGNRCELLDHPNTPIEVTEDQYVWAERFVTQCVEDLATRLEARVGMSDLDTMVKSVSRHLAAELSGRRTDHGERMKGWLEEGLIPVSLINRYLRQQRKIKVIEPDRVIAHMVASEMIEPLSADEVFVTKSRLTTNGIMTKRGRTPEAVYRALPALYGS